MDLFLRVPGNVERRMMSSELRKQRGYAPRTGHPKGSGIKRVVGLLGRVLERQRRKLSFDLAVDDVRPVALDAHQRCAGRTVERAVRILPAASHRRLNLIVP